MEKLSSAAIKKLVALAPESGLAEIRLVNPKRTGTITVRGYNDETGDFRPFVDQHGNERVIRINKKVLLDLSKLKDQLTYEQVRLHPIYVKGATPVLKLINHEVEDENFVITKDLEAKANGIIQNLKDSELKDFARVLLIPIREGSSITAIKRTLYDKAAEDPTEIINEFENPDRELKSILQKGLEKDLFTKSGGVFKFKGTVMGTSYELAVEWLRENEDILPSIRKELK